MMMTKPIAVFSILVLAAGIIQCSAFTRKKDPIIASPSLKKELEKAQIELAANDTKRAYKRLKSIAEKNPGTDISDDALMMLGQIDYQRRDYEAAYSFFIAIVNSDVFSPNEGEALLWASRSLHRLGRLDEALSLSNKGLRIPGLSPEVKLDFQKQKFDLLTDLGDRLDALRTIVYIAENDPDSSTRESFRVRAMDYVDGRLSAEELKAVADSRDFSLVRGHAQYRVGMEAFEQRDFSLARSYLSDAGQSLPGTEVEERSREVIAVIDSRRRVDPRTVGAVLPLTGRHASIARKSLKGLQLGLGIYGKGKSDLRLAVIDSGGNPDTARRAVERLVTEDHVIAVVGSLLSRTATAVAGKSDELGVPSIALSQKSGITEVGESVFRNALTSEMQMRRLARIAVNDLGLKRFAILYPNDSYGVEFANLFWDEIQSRGGKIVAAQVYSPSETDFSGPIKRLVGQYYLEDRLPEYKFKLREWFSAQKSLNARSKVPEDLLRPIVDFDALFVPDTVKALKQIAPTLKFYDVNGVRLLGTNLWNSKELPQIAHSHSGLEMLFVDTLTQGDSEFKKSDFYRNYMRVFGEPPGPFEAQGYDTGLLIRQALAGGVNNRVDLSRALSRIESFPGSLGLLHQEGPRELSLPAYTLTVEKGAIELFDFKRKN